MELPTEPKLKRSRITSHYLMSRSPSKQYPNIFAAFSGVKYEEEFKAKYTTIYNVLLGQQQNLDIINNFITDSLKHNSPKEALVPELIEHFKQILNEPCQVILDILVNSAGIFEEQAWAIALGAMKRFEQFHIREDRIAKWDTDFNEIDFTSLEEQRKKTILTWLGSSITEHSCHIALDDTFYQISEAFKKTTLAPHQNDPFFSLVSKQVPGERIRRFMSNYINKHIFYKAIDKQSVHSERLLSYYLKPHEIEPDPFLPLSPGCFRLFEEVYKRASDLAVGIIYDYVSEEFKSKEKYVNPTNYAASLISYLNKDENESLRTSAVLEAIDEIQEELDAIVMLETKQKQEPYFIVKDDKVYPQKRFFAFLVATDLYSEFQHRHHAKLDPRSRFCFRVGVDLTVIHFSIKLLGSEPQQIPLIWIREPENLCLFLHIANEKKGLSNLSQAFKLNLCSAISRIEECLEIFIDNQYFKVLNQLKDINLTFNVSNVMDESRMLASAAVEYKSLDLIKFLTNQEAHDIDQEFLIGLLINSFLEDGNESLEWFLTNVGQTSINECRKALSSIVPLHPFFIKYNEFLQYITENKKTNLLELFLK